MKNTLILTMLAAAFLGSGGANAEEGTLYASKYTGGQIVLGSSRDDDKLVVDVPLTLTGFGGVLFLWDGATLAFSKENGAESICRIFTSVEVPLNTVYFKNTGDIYNFTFDAGAQAIVAASAGTPITLIQDPNEERAGFKFSGGATPSNTTLKLNGKEVGEKVSMGSVEFTYVGPQDDTYTFKEGEIGFTGYENGSHALKLAHGGGLPTPEPATGSLSLLALAGLCARRRRK